MARPPGTSFLGAQPTTVKACLGEYGKNPIALIADSGSDITLISSKTLKEMQNPPKVKIGQELGLLEVTGETTIDGYVSLSIFIDTNKGPVELFVEAYVVKNMTAPFLLGNDFADQYCISIIRSEEESYLQFGDSERKTNVVNSIGPSLTTEKGHAFTIKRKIKDPQSKAKSHRRNQKKKKHQKLKKRQGYVRSAIQVVIQPKQCVKVPVTANFTGNDSYLFVERLFNVNKNPDDVYGAPDSLISLESPYLHVSNFSSQPIKIFPGQALGIAHSPRNWLDSPSQDMEVRQAQEAHAQLIRTMAEGLLQPKNYTGPDEPNSDSVEGGPKTAETPEESCSSDKLLQEIHFSPDLTQEQVQALQDIIQKNSSAFGLDGRLGHYEESNLEIKLKPDSTPVSLPPFGASSPEKRKVMDESGSTTCVRTRSEMVTETKREEGNHMRKRTCRSYSRLRIT